MRFKLISVCGLLMFLSCASSNNNQVAVIEGAADFSSAAYSSLMNTPPEGDTPVFFAAAPRMSNREEEIDICLINAAIQASKFVAVNAISYFSVKENNKDLYYFEGLDVQYDISLAEELIKDLTVLRELQDRNGTYIHAKLANKSVSPIPYNLPLSGSTPAWVKDFPAIDGYYVGVGNVRRTGWMDDSFRGADEQALMEIIRQISVNLNSKRVVYEVDTVGGVVIQERREIAEATVFEYYILARWVSPDGSNYYSLAVCPRAKNNRIQ